MLHCTANCPTVGGSGLRCPIVIVYHSGVQWVMLSTGERVAVGHGGACCPTTMPAEN